MALKSNIARFRAGLSQAIDQGVDETAEQVATLERSTVAVDTGALRASIEVFGAAGSGSRTVSAGQSLDYAPFVEFGGRGPAQPFVTPAAEAARVSLPKNVGARVKALADRSRV